MQHTARALGALAWLWPHRSVTLSCTRDRRFTQAIPAVQKPHLSLCHLHTRNSSGATTPYAASMNAAALGGSDTGAVVVYVTVPDKEAGRKIADHLVENKLAACVNIIPGLESIYVWEGKVNRDSELLMMIKSRQSLVPTLTQAVKSLHPYDECEVISLAITGGSPSYLQWVLDSTGSAS